MHSGTGSTTSSPAPPSSGIGGTVAFSDVERPFPKALALAFVTALSLGLIGYISLLTAPATEQPSVMPPPVTMIMAIVAAAVVVGAIAGGVAVACRHLRFGGRPDSKLKLFRGTE